MAAFGAVAYVEDLWVGEGCDEFYMAASVGVALTNGWFRKLEVLTGTVLPWRLRLCARSIWYLNLTTDVSKRMRPFVTLKSSIVL